MFNCWNTCSFCSIIVFKCLLTVLKHFPTYSKTCPFYSNNYSFYSGIPFIWVPSLKHNWVYRHVLRLYPFLLHMLWSIMDPAHYAGIHIVRQIPIAGRIKKIPANYPRRQTNTISSKKPRALFETALHVDCTLTTRASDWIGTSTQSAVTCHPGDIDDISRYHLLDSTFAIRWFLLLHLQSGY